MTHKDSNVGSLCNVSNSCMWGSQLEDTRTWAPDSKVRVVSLPDSCGSLNIKVLSLHHHRASRKVPSSSSFSSQNIWVTVLFTFLCQTTKPLYSSCSLTLGKWYLLKTLTANIQISRLFVGWLLNITATD